MDKQPKRANKNIKNKKKQPLKVVYITNPIMFKTDSASEFRALVQEFTGQDADTLEYSDYAAAYGGEEAVEPAVKAVAGQDNIVPYAGVDNNDEGSNTTKAEILGHEYYYPNYSCNDVMMNGPPESMVQIGSDPTGFEPFYGNVFNDPKMLLENVVEGLEGSSLWQLDQSSFSSSSTT